MLAELCSALVQPMFTPRPDELAWPLVDPVAGLSGDGFTVRFEERWLRAPPVYHAPSSDGLTRALAAKGVAVVRTELLVWPYQVLLDLYESSMEWQKLGRRVAELLYVHKEQRELSFLLLDAEGRYRQMRAQFGVEADAIPQYFLASYLGVRPQSLSRLKRKIADEHR